MNYFFFNFQFLESRNKDFRIPRGRFDLYLIGNLEIIVLKVWPYLSIFWLEALLLDPRVSEPRSPSGGFMTNGVFSQQSTNENYRKSINKNKFF